LSVEGGGASRSTDPAAGTSTATDVSLREFVAAQLATIIALIENIEKQTDMRFDAMDRQVKAAFESSQRAIDKADEATEKRFEGVNEFRAALSDQATRFVTIDQLHSMADKFEANYRRNREDLDKLTTRVNLREGEETGSRLTYANMAVLLGVTGGVIGTIIVLMNVLTN
jgi:hypothetical protein